MVAGVVHESQIPQRKHCPSDQILCAQMAVDPENQTQLASTLCVQGRCEYNECVDIFGTCHAQISTRSNLFYLFGFLIVFAPILVWILASHCLDKILKRYQEVAVYGDVCDRESLVIDDRQRTEGG